MKSLKARAEAFGCTELELRAEMAAALGRLGRKLDSLILQLQNLAKAGEASEEFRKLQKEAELHLWYLMVQREAIGIRDHKNVFECYPIPDLP